MKSRPLLHVFPALVALSLVAAFLACGRGDDGSGAPSVGGPAASPPRGPTVSAVQDVASDLGRATLAFRQEGGALVAVGRRHRVRVEGGTWSFSTTGAALTFGGTRLARAGAAGMADGAPRAIGAQMVEIDRSLARERLENRAGAVEQSWSFARAPEGEGDLVVRVPVSGAPFLASTASGLHFGAPGMGVRYGVATFVDAAGARTTVQPRFVDAAIELRVPEAVLARAAYPAVLDPVIGGETGVDTPPSGLADVGNVGNEPAMAFDGTNWLVVWTDDRGGRLSNVMAARVGPDGTPLDADDILVAPGLLTQPSQPASADVAVTFDGTNYLVAWSDLRSGTWDIYAARVSKAGVVLDPGGFAVSTAAGDQTAPAVAFDGNEYMVVWNDTRSGSPLIFGSRVSVGGSVLNTSGIQISTLPGAQAPTISFGATGYLVAWSNGTLFGELVTPNGAVTKTFPIAQAVVQQHDYASPSAAFAGGEFLVAYLDDHTPGGFSPADVLATIVNTDGSLGTTVTVGSETIGGALPYGARLRPAFPTYPYSNPSAASDGTAFAVAYVDPMNTAIRVQTIDFGGALVGAPPAASASLGQTTSTAIAAGAAGTYGVAFFDASFRTLGVDDAVVSFAQDAGAAGTTHTLSTSTANETGPSIVFGGNNQYLVTWADSRNLATSAHDVFGVFVDANGAVLTATPFGLAGPANDDVIAPAAAFDGTRYLLCWQDQTTARVPCQLVDTSGASIGPIVDATSGQAVGENPRVSYDGQSFLVMWADLGHQNVAGAHVSDLGDTAQVTEAPFVFPAVPPDYDPALAHGPANDQLVTWVNAGNVFAAKITPSFQGPSDAGPMQTTSINGGKAGAAVAYDGTVWVVAMVQQVSRSLLVARVDATGFVTGSEVDIPGAFAASESERPTAAFDGTNTILAWTELHNGSLDVYGARVDTSGNVLDYFPIAADPKSDERAPQIASGGGGKAVVVYERYDTQTNALHASARLLSEVTNQAIGAACTSTAECVAGATCVDFVCCSTACNVNDPLRCTACSVATGATANGTCTNVANRVCRPAAGECDIAEACNGSAATCPGDMSAPNGTLCVGGTCMNGVCIGGSLPDAGQDAAADAQGDAMDMDTGITDAAGDTGADAAIDAPADAPADAPVDAPADAPAEASAPDAGTDAGVDAATPKDAGADTGPKPDAAPPVDAGEDASPIVVLDSGSGGVHEDASITTFPPADEGGCSCRVVSSGQRGGARTGGLAALGALAAVLAARRVRRRARAGAAVAATLGAIGLVVACSGKKLPPPGEMILAVQTDMSLPKDVDGVRIRVTVSGRPSFDQTYAAGPDGVHIPATIGLLAGSNPADPVTIKVIALKGTKSRVLRQAITTVPTDRLAMLRMPLQWVCEGRLAEMDTDVPGEKDVVSDCPDPTQACIDGVCQDSHVDGKTLPDYSPAAVYGGGTGDASDGACFDTLGCFDGSTEANLDTASCTIEAPADLGKLNVALRLPPMTDGICSGDGKFCLIPLDSGEGGWTSVTTSAGTRVQLPTSVCDRIAQKKIETVMVTSKCDAKTNALPTCGPWSSSGGTQTTTTDASAPSCSDNVKDGDESDVDCGGSCKGKCANGRACKIAKDCSSGFCQADGTCATPPADAGRPDAMPVATCTDGQKNGNETDVDCGGSCPNKCGLGQGCAVPADCTTTTCSATKSCDCPFSMIAVASAGSGRPNYCIDPTEATNGQYLAFLSTNPSLSLQPAFCGFNTSYTPAGTWPLPGKDNLPVANVSWCDAFAYCAASGKRLCGKVGGGAMPSASFADPINDQWMSACSKAGANPFPYGASFSSSACNGVGGPGAGTTVTVASDTMCVSYGGLFDLSGNVAEWEDSCDLSTGASDNCHARGGSFASQQSDLRCDAATAYPRNTTDASVGIRCCFF